MTMQQADALRSFDLISQAAQQRLQERIAAANGGIESIRQEIQAELARLDGEETNGMDSAAGAVQADRAFYVGQLAYLDLIEQAATTQSQSQKQSVWSRFRSTFRRAEAAR